MQSGNIFVISAPSGAGKSSLVKALCRKDKQIKVSVSHTTRSIRPGEQEGLDYYFIPHTDFVNMLEQKQFLEYAKVYDNYYGTHINTIKQLLEKGQDIVLEIDWQGARQVKQLFPQAILIFILPPNAQELQKRLTSRNTDSPETIKKRLDLAIDDISHADEFDYTIINDNFDMALHELYSIITVQRFKTERVLKSYKF